MCRLFGFQSVILSKVHTSLVQAENALISQSLKHPDGWGVAYYRENTPHLIKSMARAIDDHIFHKVSGVVSSHTVLAHIRKATHGNLSILNSHPFQYGQWVFAHNGNIKNFNDFKVEMLDLVDPDLRRFILGTTDSEIFFFILLTELKKVHKLSDPDIPIDKVQTCLEKTVNSICKMIGPLYGGDDQDPTQNHLTCILTSGKMMVAFNGGQNLSYSTHKTKCSDSFSCAQYSPICEEYAKDTDLINHLLFSSEVLRGENVWQKMKKGEFIGVDSKMIFKKNQLNVPFE